MCVCEFVSFYLARYDLLFLSIYIFFGKYINEHITLKKKIFQFGDFKEKTVDDLIKNISNLIR